MVIARPPTPTPDESSQAKYEKFQQKIGLKRRVRQAKEAQRKQKDVSEARTTEDGGELKIEESCTVQLEDRIQEEDEQMGVAEEGMVQETIEEQQEEADLPLVQNRWMGIIDMHQYYPAEDDSRSESISGSTLVDEWPSEDEGMVEAKKERQDDSDWPQKQNSGMESIDVNLILPTEDDSQGQSLSGITLISSWNSEIESYDAAPATDIGPYKAAREEFVFLIKNERRLKNLRNDIEKLLQPEIFEESFRNMLMMLATQLRSEANHSEEKDAARAVAINRIYIANCITQWIFKMVEFQPTPGRKDVLESFLRKYRQKGGVDNDVQIFERGEDDELDQSGENEIEGPINLLKIEAFIKSSRAWSKLFDNLEGWIRDIEKAKGLGRKKQEINSNNQNPPEQDTQGQETSSDDTSPLTFSPKRMNFMHWSSYSIGSSTTRIENSTEVCNTVATLQVALLWAWAIKTSVQLYGKSNVAMQVVLEGFAIFLPMYAMILLPREPIFKCYILCLFIPKACMVYVNALGFGILSSRTYLPIPFLRTEKVFIWLLKISSGEGTQPHARVIWHCACGDEFRRDFAEQREPDAIALFKRLCRTGNKPHLEISSTDGTGIVRYFSQGTPRIVVDPSSHAISATNRNPQQVLSVSGAGVLPDTATHPDSTCPESQLTHDSSTQGATSGMPDNAGETEQLPSATDTGEQCNEWFLLCHDHYVKAGKFLHIRIPGALDNASLMKHIREQYYTSRGWYGRYFGWRKVKRLDFSRFLAEFTKRNGEIAFRSEDWGTDADRNDKNWSPCPIGERPGGEVRDQLEHHWIYSHDSVLFIFANSSKHTFQKSWMGCQWVATELQIYISRLTPPSTIWTAVGQGISRMFQSTVDWLKEVPNYLKHVGATRSSSPNDLVELEAQGSPEEVMPADAANNDSRQEQEQEREPQQQSQPQQLSSAPLTHRGPGCRALIPLPMQQQQQSHLISDAYPRRLHTKLYPNPTCYGWGLYLDEVFAVPTPLIALLLILLFSVLISTLTVALVDFQRGDRYDAFSLPSWAVSMASLVGFILFWCCDRWR